MLLDHVKLKIGELELEANWDKEVRPAKRFRIMRKGKVITELERDELYTLLFIFADNDQQDSLVQTKKTLMREITRMLRIKVKEDMKAGDIISVPFTYPVTLDIYDELVQNKISYIGIPNSEFDTPESDKELPTNNN